MPPESKIKFRVLPQVLFRTNKPGFRPFPGIERPVELISAKRLVTISQHEQRVPEHTLDASVRKKRQAAVVAVGAKAAGKLPLGIKLLVEFPPHQDAAPLCWLIPKFPTPAPKCKSVCSGVAVITFSDPAIASDPYKVDPAPRRISRRCTSSLGTRKVHVVMAALHIIHPQPIH